MSDATLRIHIEAHTFPGRRFVDGAQYQPQIKESVCVGVQRGQAAKASVEQLVPGDSRRAEFQVEFTLVKTAAGAWDLRGPYAQGKAGERFFYLSWGYQAKDGTLVMFRRLKIPLHKLTAAQIKQGQTKPLMLSLGLTDAKGGPLCGSLKKLEWKKA